MKLILCATTLALGAQAAFEETGGAAARWKIGGKCVTMKDEGNTFARIFMKDCNAADNASQNFKLNKANGVISSHDGKRCLFFNSNTRLFTMAVNNDDVPRLCKTADVNANRFVRHSDKAAGRISLQGVRSKCVAPQRFINKRYNKLVNGQCSSITDIKGFDDKGHGNTDQTTRTYANAIYSGIYHLRNSNGGKGPNYSELNAYVEKHMGDNYIYEKFDRQMTKSEASGVFNATKVGNVYYYKNTKNIKPLGGKKNKDTNYPKRVWNALASSSNSFKNLNQILAVMKSQSPDSPVVSDKVAGILKRALDNSPSAIEKGVNGTFRLKDADCKRGLNGVCDNKHEDGKRTTSWNKMIANYFYTMDKNNNTNFHTTPAILAWIKATYKEHAKVHNGEDSKNIIKKILDGVADSTDSNVVRSVKGDSYKFKDPKCRKGLYGICDNDGDHNKKDLSYMKIVTAALRAVNNSGSAAEIFNKANATHPNLKLVVKKVEDILENNINGKNGMVSNLKFNAATKKYSLIDLGCNRGLKGVCNNSKKN